MKAHAESIWLNTFNVAYANRCGVDFEATVTRDESQVDEYDVEFVPAAAYLELKAKLDEAIAIANKALEERDRLQEELDELRSKPSVNAKRKGEYYIIDNRGTVGNCASFWAVKGNGYCCNIEEAGLFELNYSDRETDVQVPREVVETCIVKHVRLDAIRSEMKKRGLEFKGGRLK